MFRRSLRWLRLTARQIGRTCDYPILVGCVYHCEVGQAIADVSNDRTVSICRVQRHIPDGLYLQQRHYDNFQFRKNGLTSDQLIF